MIIIWVIDILKLTFCAYRMGEGWYVDLDVSCTICATTTHAITLVWLFRLNLLWRTKWIIIPITAPEMQYGGGRNNSATATIYTKLAAGAVIVVDIIESAMANTCHQISYTIHSTNNTMTMMALGKVNNGRWVKWTMAVELPKPAMTRIGETRHKDVFGQVWVPVCTSWSFQIVSVPTCDLHYLFRP